MRATNATIAAARIVRDAAEKAGAPKGLIQWIEHPSHALATALMKDPGINLILATGGPAMVRAAYESGHPSIGVGAGNTPAVIDDTADIEMVSGNLGSRLISDIFGTQALHYRLVSILVRALAKHMFGRRGR